MRPTILLVDDDKDHLVLLETLLAQLQGDRPIETVSFTSAREAFDWCCQREPDLCLVDYKMPDMDGLDFIAAIRKLPNLAQLPIVMITGFPESEIRQHALERGATALWTKPIDLGDVRARLTQFLNAHGAGSACAAGLAHPA